MNIEHDVEQHRHEFSALLDRFGVNDQYEMSWQWRQTNQSVFYIAKAKHRRSGAAEPITPSIRQSIRDTGCIC